MFVGPGSRALDALRLVRGRANCGEYLPTVANDTTHLCSKVSPNARPRTCGAQVKVVCRGAKLLAINLLTVRLGRFSSAGGRSSTRHEGDHDVRCVPVEALAAVQWGSRLLEL